ncbi:S9 family peptidase [Planctobacterium marinum]|uniref:Peptidase S9 prolyl oligopeptidase catalytic domain-containing protein n=1 Tax=Planctobacterium marinum TaxID=1631968 RepID=A0AA48KNX2_9ALTE|nr:hypothetical protein MACH26_03390 [Planctobacterium marinum]
MFKNMMPAMVLLCLINPVCAEEKSADTPFASIKSQVETAVKAPLMARELFSQSPELQNVILSPDGKHLAYTLAKANRLEIWHYSLSTDSHRRVLSTKQLKNLHWSADSHSLVYESGPAVYKVGIKVGHLAQKLFELPGSDSQFIGPDRDKPGQYWVKDFNTSTQQHQLLTYNDQGTSHPAITSQSPITGFLSQQGQLKVIKQLIAEQQQISIVNENGLQPVTHCRALSACKLHAWDPQTKTLFVSSYFHLNTLALFSVNTVSGEKTLLHQHPKQRFDLLGVSVHPSEGPQIVSYQTDYSAHFALNEAMQPIVQEIQIKTTSPQWYLRASRKHDIFLVKDSNPTRSDNEYWIYDVAQQSWRKPLAHLKQNTIPGQWIAPRIPFWYQASDGMQLQGYLILPLGYDPAAVPLIAMPHGGPWNRSQGAYSRQAQFLANRGYAVFEPNFRSSTGLGLNYTISANKDFGNGRVQQDILEGLDYLLSHGIGDSNQQAIVGHSFGGFSTLTALAFTPERFKVGFAGAAPANLAHTLLRYGNSISVSQQPGFNLRIKTLMLDRQNRTDTARLYQQSPDKHLDKIIAPLYLWAGERDERVAIEDIREIAVRLQQKQQNVVLLSDPNEGHSPESELAKEAYLYLMEEALTRHLKGHKDQTMSKPIVSYLKKYLMFDSEEPMLGESQ